MTQRITINHDGCDDNMIGYRTEADMRQTLELWRLRARGEGTSTWLSHTVGGDGTEFPANLLSMARAIVIASQIEEEFDKEAITLTDEEWTELQTLEILFTTARANYEERLAEFEKRKI